MSAMSEINASEITNILLAKLDQNIHSLEKVKQYKPVHSAQQIFGILGQLTDQISSASHAQGRLKTPHENKSLRLDSHMSVFNVEQPPQKTRQRSYTKRLRRRKTTIIDSDDMISLFRSKRRITTFNKIQSIQQKIAYEAQQIQVDETERQERKQLEKNLQAQIQKRKIEDILQKSQLAKPKIISSRMLRQKMSYDYQYGRLLVKSQVQNNLVSSQKSLVAETSKHVLKTEVSKQKPKVIHLQTTKVVQKVANRTKKAKTQNEVVEVQQQPLEIQFSKLYTLVDKFNCEPGVSINFDGSTLKSRRSKSELASISTPRQYSKIEYLMLKKRSSTSFNEMTPTEDRKLAPISLLQPKSLGKLPNHDKTKAKVVVSNNELRGYLLQSDMEEIQSYSASETKQVRKTPSMDKTDYFNLNYIRGIKSPLTTAIPTQRLRIVLPLISSSRIPQIKVREKLENRKAFIAEMRKKFEQTLRNNQSSNI